MLNQETKRRIDSSRDILVGKVPDPKAQVEQITTAMIYKFMDDMDKEAQEVGGKAKFFTNGYEKYSWTNILDPKLGGQERLNLYGEAITKMQNNPHIPQLFRDIFKDAFLPYRSPETLSMFLKEINGFKYLHSEDLGDAFEYLLSVLGSQGDAGQFRTPRHIIDFIVDVVDPKKEDTILDPACGTAGFLISSFKHIVGSNKPSFAKASEGQGKNLSPEDKKRMMNNIVGYDISPDMVKLSKVNMYLHGFPTPHIYEYDTLSSEDRWEETYDVIMANPPFMSPKGGIKPHKRFSIQANRAEVLFVDYIMEHLNTNGRAGIIIPEGIIFQSGGSYTGLRKQLLEKGLWGVVSLPVGVFNPYTKTTKTSILFLDKNIQKKTEGVLFVKINNDGFDLGAERKPISENDLPKTLKLFKQYINSSLINKETSVINRFIHLNEITKRITNNFAVFNEVEEQKNTNYQNIEVGKILKQIKNTVIVNNEKIYKQITVKMNGKGVILRKEIKGSNIKTKTQFLASHKDFIMSKIDARNGAFGIVPPELNNAIVTSDFPLFRVNESVMLPNFLNIVIRSPQFIKICQLTSLGTSNRKRIQVNKFLNSRIPLPTLEGQKKIVKEIEEYKKNIEDNKKIILIFEKKIEEKLNKVWK